MNRSKKALVVAAVFVSVGVIGSIVSGALAVPKVLKEISTARTNFKNEREKEILVLEDNIENLNIDSFEGPQVLVEIRKSKDDKFRVKEYEDLFEKIDVKADYDKENKTLKVNSKSNDESIKPYNIKNYSIKGLYNEFIKIIANEPSYGRRIIVECASPVNITLNGNFNMNVEVRNEEVLKDSFNASGVYNSITLPLFNNLKNININTDSYVNMDLREFINAENVKISAHNIYISSKGTIDEYSSLKKFPKNVSLNGDNIEVVSYIPLGENVSINAMEDFKVYSDLESYNIKGKVSIIDKDDSHDKEDKIEDLYDKHDSYEEDDEFDHDYRGENYLNGKLKNGIYEGQISKGSIGNFNINFSSSDEGKLINVPKEELQRKLGF